MALPFSNDGDDDYDYNGDDHDYGGGDNGDDADVDYGDNDYSGDDYADDDYGGEGYDSGYNGDGGGVGDCGDNNGIDVYDKDDLDIIEAISSAVRQKNADFGSYILYYIVYDQKSAFSGHKLYMTKNADFWSKTI